MGRTAPARPRAPKPRATAAAPPDPWRWALPAVVTLAVLLRLAHLGAGLPVLREEAIPFRLALAMKDVSSGAIDWNPHQFDYPSLSIYVHFVVQQLTVRIGQLLGWYANFADYFLSVQVDPSGPVRLARLVGVAADAFTIVAAARIAERLARGSGILAAALLALSPTLIATSRLVYCDPLMVAGASWAIERLLAHLDTGRARDAFLAAALVGLAAGAKYPAGALVVPLAGAVFAREGGRGAARAALTVALAAAVFVLTTPYALLDFAHFRADFAFESVHAARGHLGSEGSRAAFYQAAELLRNLGAPGLLALLAAPFVLWREPARRGAVGVTGVAIVAFALPIALARIEAERYLTPVVALAAPLLAAGAVAAYASVPRRVPAPLAFALALLLLAPVAIPGARAAITGTHDTRDQALAWFRARGFRDALVFEESYAADLPSLTRLREAAAQPAWALASAATRARFASLEGWHALTLPLMASGEITTTIAAGNGEPVPLTVLPLASAYEGVFYDPALLANADLVVTSSSVRGRFASDPARYPAEVAAYARLDRDAARLARFAPGAGVDGPEIVVYGMTDRFRTEAGALDPRTWTNAIPDSIRAHAHALIGGAPGGVPVEPWASPSAEPPAWARALTGVFDARVRPFLEDAAAERLALGPAASAAALARPGWVIAPQEQRGTLLYASALAADGRWDAVRAAIERARDALPADRLAPSLRHLHALALAHSGDAAAARAELAALRPRLAPGDPLRAIIARAADSLAAAGAGPR